MGCALFTRMLYRPSSRAETRVMLSSAALGRRVGNVALQGDEAGLAGDVHDGASLPSRIMEADALSVTSSARGEWLACRA